MQHLTLAKLHELAQTCPFDFGQALARLDDETIFLGSGADLSPATLLHAYCCGVFPWFEGDEPICWWSPNPRCVIEPIKFTPSKSLVRCAKKQPWTVTTNLAFVDVMQACIEPRTYTTDTWITQSMQQAYHRLHDLGVAVSIEVWQGTPRQSALIGGLYGLNIGSLFCGESMFHRVTDASKIAFWALMVLCRRHQIHLVDCQLENAHLMSLGATLMKRDDFRQQLASLIVTKPKAMLHQVIQMNMAELVATNTSKILSQNYE